MRAAIIFGAFLSAFLLLAIHEVDGLKVNFQGADWDNTSLNLSDNATVGD